MTTQHCMCVAYFFKKQGLLVGEVVSCTPTTTTHRSNCQSTFLEYGWTLVGTINATDKKLHQDCDIPFLKLSNGASNTVKRGWFCKAALKLHTHTGKTY